MNWKGDLSHQLTLRMLTLKSAFAFKKDTQADQYQVECYTQCQPLTVEAGRRGKTGWLRFVCLLRWLCACTGGLQLSFRRVVATIQFCTECNWRCFGFPPWEGSRGSLFRWGFYHICRPWPKSSSTAARRHHIVPVRQWCLLCLTIHCSRDSAWDCQRDCALVKDIGPRRHTAGPKCDVFREGFDKKRHKFEKIIFVCESVTFFPEMWHVTFSVTENSDKCDVTHPNLRREDGKKSGSERP